MDILFHYGNITHAPPDLTILFCAFFEKTFALIIRGFDGSFPFPSNLKKPHFVISIVSGQSKFIF